MPITGADAELACVVPSPAIASAEMRMLLFTNGIVPGRAPALGSELIHRYGTPVNHAHVT